MATFTQLSFDFFWDMPLAKVVSMDGSCAAPVDTVSDLDAAALRQGILSEVLNPCAHCELADFCGHDDCAMHLFPLDVPEREYGDWEDVVLEYDSLIYD